MAGTLSLRFRKGKEHFGSAVDVASRENDKRTFSFINRVLGKHFPVRPSIAREVFDELAYECNSYYDTLVVGMAEMAVGFGGCIADSLKKVKQEGAVYYQHTTRQSATKPIWFGLSEVHSHATDHLYYAPSALLVDDIVGCQHLVLVDDEITTGKTMLALTKSLLQRIGSVKLITVVSLANWMPRSARSEFEGLGPTVHFFSLLDGEFEFLADPRYVAQLPRCVDYMLSDTPCSFDAGRAGVEIPISVSKQDLAAFEGSDPLVVMGMSENTFQPFMVAESLEKSGREVLFHSTTRSPLALGDAIKSKRSFSVGNGRLHFVYNEPEGYVRHPLFETVALQNESGFTNTSVT